jgi:hypothetical protein
MLAGGRAAGVLVEPRTSMVMHQLQFTFECGEK